MSAARWATSGRDIRRRSYNSRNNFQTIANRLPLAPPHREARRRIAAFLAGGAASPPLASGKQANTANERRARPVDSGYIVARNCQAATATSPERVLDQVCPIACPDVPISFKSTRNSKCQKESSKSFQEAWPCFLFVADCNIQRAVFVASAIAFRVRARYTEQGGAPRTLPCKAAG